MPSELAVALAKVQGELQPIPRTQEGQAGTRKVKYADLSAVAKTVYPLLAKNGLAFTAKPTLRDGRFILAYSLLHASGEREDGEYPLHGGGNAQQNGSEVTYARRYCLCAITGATPEGEDDDGASAAKAAQSRPRAAQKPTAATPGQRQPVRADPEHERLRDGTVERTPEDVGRTTRTRTPGHDDPWAGQPAGQTPKPVNGNGQVGVIAQHFKRLEVIDRDERLALTAQLAGWAEGREITSTNDLTAEEKTKVLNRLGQLRDHAALMALVTSGDSGA